jgi:uncharacterized protein
MNETAQFARGVAHFNGGEFFEAHEVWEEIWLRAPAEEKPFLQGLIQIAAAFHHYKRGNLSGARSLLAAGTAKIRAFPGSHRGIDVDQLLRDLSGCEEKIRDRSVELPRIQLSEKGI